MPKHDPSVVIAGPRGRGRPKAAQPSERVSTWLPVGDYNRLLRLARAREQSISGVVRDLLATRLR